MAAYTAEDVVNNLLYDSDIDAESVCEIDEDSDFLLPTLSSDDGGTPAPTASPITTPRGS